MYAIDRKLNTKEREDVKKLIDLGAPVRKIQNYIYPHLMVSFTPTFSDAFLISNNVKCGEFYVLHFAFLIIFHIIRFLLLLNTNIFWQIYAASNLSPLD